MKLELDKDYNKILKKWMAYLDLGHRVDMRFLLDGEYVSTKEDLITVLNKKTRTIARYISDGMPQHEASTKILKLYRDKDVLKWVSVNIDKSMSVISQCQYDEEYQTGDLQDIDNNKKDSSNSNLSDMERKLRADADDAELKVRLNQIKLSEAEGRVVDANDLDRAMSELAVIHKTDKSNDENLLPTLLENKNAGEIKTLLTEHNQNRLDMLDKIINRTFNDNVKMYEIVNTILESLSDGKKPSSIIKKIREV